MKLKTIKKIDKNILKCVNNKNDVFFIKFQNLNLYPDISLIENYKLILDEEEKYLIFPSGERFLINDVIKV